MKPNPLTICRRKAEERIVATITDPFLRDYQIAKVRKEYVRLQRLERQANQATTASGSPNEFAEARKERKRTRNRIKREIFTTGVTSRRQHERFTFPDGSVRVLYPVFPEATIVGFPSDDHDAAKRIVAGTRQGRHMRTGKDKDVVFVQTGDKCIDLAHAPYIELKREMLSVIRVDIDGLSVGGLATILEELERLVAEGKLPSLPNCMTGRDYYDPKEPNSPYYAHGCHLYWILPAAVNMKSTGRSKPKNLLKAVYRGIVAALAHLDADDRASVTLARGKNPLVPDWDTYWLTERVVSLQEWRQYVRTDLTPQALSELVAQVTSRLPSDKSNSVFQDATKKAFALLNAMKVRGDAVYLDAVAAEDRQEALVALLMDLVRPSDTTAEGSVIQRALRFSASHWNPEHGATQRLRGRDDDAIPPDAGRAERQAISARRTSADRRRASIDAVSAAYASFVAKGLPVQKKAVAEAAGVSRKTATLVWEDAVQACNLRCIDKKVTCQSGSWDDDRTIRAVKDMDDPAPTMIQSNIAVCGETPDYEGSNPYKAVEVGSPRRIPSHSWDPTIVIRGGRTASTVEPGIHLKSEPGIFNSNTANLENAEEAPLTAENMSGYRQGGPIRVCQSAVFSGGFGGVVVRRWHAAIIGDVVPRGYLTRSVAGA